QGVVTLRFDGTDLFNLTGFLELTAGSDGVRIAGAVSTTILYLGTLSGNIDFSFNTHFIKDGNDLGVGLVGRVGLALNTNAVPGVTFNGYFVLEVNTYSQAVTVNTFATKGEAHAFDANLYPAPPDNQTNQLATKA